MQDEKKPAYSVLLQHIQTGRNNGRHRAELARLTGMDTRTVSALILRARLDGEIICSDNAGFYRPSDAEEAGRYYQRHYAQAITQLKSLKSTRRFLKEQEKEKTEETTKPSTQ